MTSGPSGAQLMKQLRALCDGGAVGGLTDGPLLDRFLARRDSTAETEVDSEAEAEAAFRVLVERHGPMVFRVCRAILRDPHDAEDAAQAVFLILARRAESIRSRDSVASWLFGVACRVAARAKLDAARQRRRERQSAALAAQQSRGDQPRPEAWDLLYEEIKRLPESFRAVIILCDLEGLTHEQAAHQLQGSVRTVQRRLEQGRSRLRRRLAPQVGSLANRLPSAAIASTSMARDDATARAAVRFALNPAATTAGTVPAAVATLAEGVLKTMAMNTLKLTALTCFTTGILAGVLGSQVRSAGPVPPTPPPPPAADPLRARAESRPAPTAVALLAPVETARELAHDDGEPAGKKSIAGSAHAVRFESPGEGWSLTRVRLHGARYGYPQPPDEDFTVYLCDEDFKPIASFPFPYSRFKRGKETWVDLDVKPTKVPAKFIVCVGFDPTQTKGVYVSHDGQKTPPDENGSGSSMTGLPPRKPRPFTQGHWLIRARVEPPKKSEQPR